MYEDFVARYLDFIFTGWFYGTMAVAWVVTVFWFYRNNDASDHPNDEGFYYFGAPILLAALFFAVPFILPFVAPLILPIAGFYLISRAIDALAKRTR